MRGSIVDSVSQYSSGEDSEPTEPGRPGPASGWGMYEIAGSPFGDCEEDKEEGDDRRTHGEHGEAIPLQNLRRDGTRSTVRPEESVSMAGSHKDENGNDNPSPASHTTVTGPPPPIPPKAPGRAVVAGTAGALQRLPSRPVGGVGDLEIRVIPREPIRSYSYSYPPRGRARPRDEVRRYNPSNRPWAPAPRGGEGVATRPRCPSPERNASAAAPVNKAEIERERSPQRRGFRRLQRIARHTAASAWASHYVPWLVAYILMAIYLCWLVRILLASTGAPWSAFYQDSALRASYEGHSDVVNIDRKHCGTIVGLLYAFAAPLSHAVLLRQTRRRARAGQRSRRKGTWKNPIPGRLASQLLLHKPVWAAANLVAVVAIAISIPIVLAQTLSVPALMYPPSRACETRGFPTSIRLTVEGGPHEGFRGGKITLSSHSAREIPDVELKMVPVNPREPVTEYSLYLSKLGPAAPRSVKDHFPEGLNIIYAPAAVPGGFPNTYTISNPPMYRPQHTDGVYTSGTPNLDFFQLPFPMASTSNVTWAWTGKGDDMREGLVFVGLDEAPLLVGTEKDRRKMWRMCEVYEMCSAWSLDEMMDEREEVGEDAAPPEGVGAEDWPSRSMEKLVSLLVPLGRMLLEEEEWARGCPVDEKLAWGDIDAFHREKISTY
ncbi:hypothetical protein DFH27DRAFT_557946 [Peziza echinospora]|nr:hypothetical protein DFH27DRAFT_557946 [Peziza echinospora]